MGLEIFLVQVVCGSSYTAALADDGCVYTWGCGDSGVLGQNDTSDRFKPTLIKDLQGMDIVKIAAGGSHMFACTSRESYAWGWNGCGQLGLGHEEDQLRPQSVEVLRGHEVKDIAAGAAHSFALVAMAKLKTDVLYSWGSNACGQLGQGKKVSKKDEREKEEEEEEEEEEEQEKKQRKEQNRTEQNSVVCVCVYVCVYFLSAC